MYAQNVTEVHGHRGCRGWYPENAMAGFLYALDMGVDVLEMDVVMNGDGQLVVSHEPWMNERICNIEGGKENNIFKMTQQEIAQVDCGLRFHKKFKHQEKIAQTKPLFSEVVYAVLGWEQGKSRRVKFNVEIKYEQGWEGIYCPSRGVFVDQFFLEVAMLGIEDRTILQCFDAGILRLAKDRNADVALSFLVKKAKNIEKDIDFLGFVPSYYSPYFRSVNAKTILKAHSLGTKIVPWTVNKERRMKKMIKLGADGIISDYPDRVLKVKNEYMTSFQGSMKDQGSVWMK